MAVSLRKMMQHPATGCDQIRYLIAEQSTTEEAQRELAVIDVASENLRAQAFIGDYRKEMSRYAIGTSFAEVCLEPQDISDIPLLNSVISDFNDTTLEDTLNQFVDQQRSDIEEELCLRINKWQKKKGNTIKKLAEMNPLQRAETLYSDAYQGIESLQSNVKGLVDGVRTTLLCFGEDALNTFADKGKDLFDEGKKIKDLELNAVGIGKALLTFADQTQSEFSQIGETLGRLKAKVGDKKKWLNQLNLENLSKSDRAEMNSLLGNPISLEDLPQGAKDFIEDSKDLLGKVQKYAQGAQAFIGIAERCRIKIPEKVQKGVDFATNAANIGMSLLSGPINPLGIINAVTGVIGLFGKKKKKRGPDISTQRHAQIMKAFNHLAEGQSKILGGQKVMIEQLNNLAEGQQALFAGQQRIHQALEVGFTHLDRKLEDIHRSISSGINSLEGGQKQIMENQKAMFDYLETLGRQLSHVIDNQVEIGKSIQTLSHSLEKKHIEIMTALHEQTQRIMLIGMHVHLGRIEDAYNCKEIINSLIMEKEYDARRNRFLSYLSLKEFYTKNRIPFKKGLKYLYLDTRGVGSKPKDSKFFSLDSPEDVNKPNQSDVRAFTKYSDFWSFVSNKLAPTAIPSAINPTKKLSQLQAKAAAQESEETEALAPFKNTTPQLDTSRVLNNLYSYKTVRDYALFAYRLHYFFDLIDDEYRLTDISNLPTTASSKGLEVLENSLTRLNIAIAQLTLYTGDASLEVFYRLLTSPETSEQDQVIAFKLLSENRLLAENFVLYLFTRISQSNDPHFVSYYHANSKPNNAALKELLPGNHWNLEGSKNNWSLKFNELEIPLPTTKTLRNSELEVPREVEELVKLRQKLIGELMGYRYLNDPRKKAFAKQIFRGLIKA